MDRHGVLLKSRQEACVASIWWTKVVSVETMQFFQEKLNDSSGRSSKKKRRGGTTGDED